MVGPLEDMRKTNGNSESDYFFFSSTKIRIFFQQHWESEYFFQVKWSFPKCLLKLPETNCLYVLLFDCILNLIQSFCHKLMWISGKKNSRCARQKKNILTLVLSGKKILNETKNHNPSL
jgi:hypothetical protein